MRIKDGFIVRKVAGQDIVVPVEEMSKKFKGMVRLNDTGRFLYDILVDGSDEDALVKAILDEYEVDEQTAREDVKKFVKSLLEVGAIEP